MPYWQVTAALFGLLILENVEKKYVTEVFCFSLGTPDEVVSIINDVHDVEFSVLVFSV